MIRKLTLPLLVAVCAPMSAAAGQEAPDTLALARQYAMWLYEGEADSLVAHSTESAKAGFATVDAFLQRTDMIAMRAGMEVEVIEEAWKLRNGRCQYWRTARFSEMDEPLLLRWVLDEHGLIAAAGLSPLSEAPPVEQEHC